MVLRGSDGILSKLGVAVEAIREGFLEEVVSEERIEERAAVCNVKRGFN